MNQNRHRIFAALAVLVASAVCAAPAAAVTTHVVRPTSTTVMQWTTAPAATDLASVLDDAVTRPETPSTSGDYAVINAKGTFDAGAALAQPVLAADETPTATRLFAYLQVGAATTVYLTLWVDNTTFVYATIPAGSPAGWYGTPAIALTRAQLAMAGGYVRAEATAGYTATRVYAMAAEIETNGEPAPTATQVMGGPGSAGAPTGGGDLPGGTSTTGDAGKRLGTAGTQTAVSPVVLPDASTPLVFTPETGAVPVQVGCAAAAGRCRGTIVLRVAGLAPRHKRAQAARCGRGCREVGKGRFDIAAGQKKKVDIKVAKAAKSLFAGRRKLRATMIVTTRTGSGKATTTSRTVTLTRAG